MLLKQFHIYSADCKPVDCTVGDARNIEFMRSCIRYSFYDIEEEHALALYHIVNTAFNTGNGFFGKVGDAVFAYCDACHIRKPWGHQTYR